MIRRPPRSTLFPYTTALPISHERVPERVRAVLRVRRVQLHRQLRIAPLPRQLEPLQEVLGVARGNRSRSEEHTSELQSRQYLVCRLLLEKKKKSKRTLPHISC